MVILVISKRLNSPYTCSMAGFGTPLCLKGVSSLAAYRAYGETLALVPGVVYEGEPTLLAGAAGCNKTTMAMQISAAITDPSAEISLPWGPSTRLGEGGGLVVYLDFEKRGKLSGELERDEKDCSVSLYITSTPRALPQPLTTLITITTFVTEERARSMGLDMRGVKWLESPMLTDDRGHVYNGEA